MIIIIYCYNKIFFFKCHVLGWNYFMIFPVICLET
jgi:hypothetical protein